MARNLSLLKGGCFRAGAQNEQGRNRAIAHRGEAAKGARLIKDRSQRAPKGQRKVRWIRPKTERGKRSSSWPGKSWKSRSKEKVLEGRTATDDVVKTPEAATEGVGVSSEKGRVNLGED